MANSTGRRCGAHNPRWEIDGCDRDAAPCSYLESPAPDQ
jgi:hypothetical protein